ncbi:MAG: transporter substrate-binding domain-containing protein [Rhodospirillales bacterium]|nr:transporter substrate-binding domain-containing protein [Rhodospirillales bacterium]
MKYLFTSIFLFLCWGNPPALADDDKNVFRLATGEYQPYTSEFLPHYGIDNRIISEAFGEEGIRVEFNFFPWTRALNTAKAGDVDGTLPWAKRKGREDFFHYSDPVIEVDREYFYYLKKSPFEWNPSVRNYEQLRGKTFAAIASANYGPKFQDAEANGTISVNRVQEEQQTLRMLLAGRIDIAIIKRRVAEFALNSFFSDQQVERIERRPESDDPPGYDYLLISKNAPNARYHLESFNRGLKSLRTSGRYDQLMLKFENGTFAELK